MKQFGKVILVVLLVAVTALGTFLATLLWLGVRMDAKPVQNKVEEISALLDTYFIDEYEENTVLTAAGDGAAAAMIAATGDRWSYYIPESEMALHTELSNNAYVGIGITIRTVEQGEEVVQVTPGGPAEEAGILVGDIVAAVDGHRVVDLEPDGTRNLVRGEEGTFVTVELLRNGESLTLEVERRSIVTPAAEYEMLDNNIAWIRILNFDLHCAEHTLACVDQALAEGAEALLFDVRFNGGGYKDELVEILDALLPEGEIFHTVDFAGDEDIETSDAESMELPMAVLVNADSYSAAEFFAAALQEYDAADVIGSRTSGKGNFQYTFDLSDGSAVAISSGKYFTPQGKSLTDVGIQPDVELDLSEEDLASLYYGILEPEDDEQLQAAVDNLLKKVS